VYIIIIIVIIIVTAVLRIFFQDGQVS